MICPSSAEDGRLVSELVLLVSLALTSSGRIEHPQYADIHLVHKD